MQDLIIDFLKQINIGQLIAMGGMIWFFYTRLNGKIENSEKVTKYEIDKLSARIDRLDEKLSGKVEDIDRRLCRIEGSLATQGHCLFSQQQQDKKAL